MALKRKYDDAYIKFRFIAIETNREIRLQCVICSVVLNNESLKLAKLQQHSKSIHPNLSDRLLEFFICKSKNLKKKIKFGTNISRQALSKKALSVSLKISNVVINREI